MSDIVKRRALVLGSNFRQYYDFPFAPVKGQGVWLYDAQGKVYLDAYNNVPHVGHCHPYVTAALASQASTLNTNTRYLYESVVAYAERLTATMPDGLDACIFTSSGSEANDLAWRLAQSITGADGALTLEDSYHGNTHLLDTINGQAIRMRGGAKPDWVELVPFSSMSGEGASLADQWQHAFDRAITGLARNGHKAAAFFCDTLFCANGVHTLPPGAIAPAIEHLRSAGGLWIADEIQPGLGRLGRHMWGFEALDVTPDIVTLGKPMGNGHPIGVMVTKIAYIEHFFRTNQYFNTFGGNTVSASVGLAVLDVMQREHLQSNAQVVGDYLRDGLSTLAERHNMIGDIRGCGLLIGMELVKDRATREPASVEARVLMNEACRRGVLVGVTGPNKLARNVIKIRPPLVFSKSDADKLISTLDEVLGTLPNSMPS